MRNSPPHTVNLLAELVKPRLMGVGPGKRRNRRSSFFRRNSADFTLRISRPRIRRQEHHRQAYFPCHFRKERGLRRAPFRWAKRFRVAILPNPDRNTDER
jgi:hypothetical protein